MKKVLTLVSISAALLLFGCTPAEKDLSPEDSPEENKEELVENTEDETPEGETPTEPTEPGEGEEDPNGNSEDSNGNGEDPNTGDPGEEPGDDSGSDETGNGAEDNSGAPDDGDTPDSQLADELKPETYSSAYAFDYNVSYYNELYLVPVALNSISNDTVLETVSGQGWKTTALYRLNMDKEVVEEFVLVTTPTMSSANHETHPNYLIFSKDGESVSFYQLRGAGDGYYETDPFTYDATNNAITLPTWFGSWGGNGRLVFLSSDIMVCVCTHGKNVKGEELIYMEILQRVSEEERQSWIDDCPIYGIRI